MPSHPRLTHRRAALGLTIALVVAAAGCGDDDSEAADTTTTTALPASSEIVAADYRFDQLPAKVGVGTTLTLKNASAVELHELVAVRLADEEKRTVAELAALPEAELGPIMGEKPALVLVAPPSKPGFTALGDGKLAQPGRYLLACFIPTGANPEAFLAALQAKPGEPPSVPGGPPHIASGMYAELNVE